MTASWLEAARRLVEEVILALGYVGVGLLMALENLFPPLPSELVVPFAGFLIYKGEFSFFWVLIASTLGTVLGTSLMYAFARALGEARLRALLRARGRRLGLSEEMFDRGVTVFRRHERSFLLWARLVPGLRSVISLPAGVARTPLPRFLLYTTAGSLLWNAGLLWLGVRLGENWAQVVTLVDRYEGGLVIAGVTALLIWLTFQLRQRQLKRSP